MFVRKYNRIAFGLVDFTAEPLQEVLAVFVHRGARPEFHLGMQILAALGFKRIYRNSDMADRAG